MKKLSMICFMIIAFTLSIAYADGIGNYSHGWRMGQLVKFSVKGLIFKSGEGQLLMGRESTPYIKTWTDSDGKVHKKTINPWYFSSTNKKLWPELQSNVGNYVVLEYKQSHVKMPNVDTDYEILNIEQILHLKLNKVCRAEKYIEGSKSEGIRVGRIVKASSKGTLVNSFEVMMQIGNSGAQFKNMSITDPKLFQCAVEYLKAGQKVRVRYSESIVNLNILSRETSYDVISIEPVQDLN